MEASGEPPRTVARPFLGRVPDAFILVLTLLLALGSLYLLPRLRLDSDLGSTLDPRALAEVDEVRALFPEERLVLLALPVEEPFSPPALARLSGLSELLGTLLAEGGPDRESLGSLYSPLTVGDLQRRGEALESLPLVSGPGDDPEAVRGRFAASPLLSRLFLSSDRRSWSLLLSLKDRGAELVDLIARARKAYPEIRVSGDAWYKALYQRTLDRETLPLFALAALLILGIQLRILRALLPALVLWCFSLLPTLWLLALLVAANEPLRLQYLLAPVMTLALSTSYITHFYRGWVGAGFDPRLALSRKGLIILIDAATTVLGFGSLLVSPVRELVVLGLVSIAGCLLSLVAVLAGLPAVLALSKGTMAMSGGASEAAAHEEEGPALEPRQKRFRLALWTAALLVAGVYSAGIGVGFKASDFFSPWKAGAREATWFEGAYRGLDEFSLVVGTGKENGIVDSTFFAGLGELERGLERVPGVGGAYGPPELVGEALARWEGLPGSLAPKDEVEIGETLELLSSGGGGLFSRGFVSGDWSAALVHMALSPGFDSLRDFPRIEAEARRIAAESSPGSRILVGGLIARSAIANQAFMRGQIAGTFGFFALLFVGLALVFRSLVKAALISLVPLTGFLAALGLIGILDWRLSPINALSLSVIAGTGVDNAIALALGRWNREARESSIQATLLIVGASFSLALCSAYLIVQTALLCAVGLAASTFVALWGLPVFGSTFAPPRKDP